MPGATKRDVYREPAGVTFAKHRNTDAETSPLNTGLVIAANPLPRGCL